MSRHSDWCEEHGEENSHQAKPSHRRRTTLVPDYDKEERKRREQIKKHPENFITLEKNK